MLSAATRGARTGFLTQTLAFGGFFGGLFLGSWASPYVSQLSDSSLVRIMIPLFVTFGLAFTLASLGELLAARLKTRFRLRFAHTLNATTGFTLAACMVLLASWLISSALTRLPLASIGLKIESSALVQSMDEIMPPAPVVIERIGRIVSPHGFPEVFVGREPGTRPAGEPVGPEVEAAAAAARASTVRIESEACGGLSVGSGFVAAENYIVTNAHVVAGARQPIVYDSNGRHRSTVVWFDPAIDFAVIRTAGLAGPALPLAREYAERGTTGAVVGYPGGGDLTAVSAVVLGRQEAIGRDIYSRNIAAREIYELDSLVQQGNSGGPFVLPDGSVAGVIFASAANRESIGYALTAQEIAEDLETAISQNKLASTGACAAD